MKGFFSLVVIIAVSFALFGCAQTGEPANEAENGTQGPAGAGGQQDKADDVPQPDGTAAQGEGYATYSQDTFSFDYPQALKAQESLGSYSGGRGYAFVALQNDIAEDPAILVYYIRFGNISLIADKSAETIAKSLLESDNSGQDVMGVLHQASDKGTITQFTSGNGYAGAEMTFTLTDPDATQKLYGYAIQLYDARRTVSMKARIIGMDMGTVKAVRDRFVGSARILDLPPSQ